MIKSATKSRYVCHLFATKFPSVASETCNRESVNPGESLTCSRTWAHGSKDHLRESKL